MGRTRGLIPVLSRRMRGLVAGSPAASVTCFCSVQAHIFELKGICLYGGRIFVVCYCRGGSTERSARGSQDALQKTLWGIGSRQVTSGRSGSGLILLFRGHLFPPVSARTPSRGRRGAALGRISAKVRVGVKEGELLGNWDSGKTAPEALLLIPSPQHQALRKQSQEFVR